MRWGTQKWEDPGNDVVWPPHLPGQEIKKGQEVSEESRVFSAFKS